MVSFELKKNHGRNTEPYGVEHTGKGSDWFSLFADQCLPIEDSFQYLFSWLLIFLLFMVIDDMSLIIR